MTNVWRYLGAGALGALLTLVAIMGSSFPMVGDAFVVRVFSAKDCRLSRITFFTSTHAVALSDEQLDIDDREPDKTMAFGVPSLGADEYEVTLEYDSCATAYGPPQLVEPGDVFYLRVDEAGRVDWHKRA